MVENAPRATLLALGIVACTFDVPAPGDDGTEECTAHAGVDAATTPSESADDGSSDAPLSAGDGSAGDTTGTGGGVPIRPTEENLRVAFFGDHGLGAESVATLELVRSEDADLLVILGDFDYGDDPTAWHEQLDEGLGEDFPMLAVAGNHDTAEWCGYREVLLDRLAPIADADCEGEIGVQMGCRYRGLELVLSGVGTMDPPGDTSHEEFIADRLFESEQIWRVCAWHKNQNDMQAGTKGDEVGWAAYQACQQGGAIVATGHEHSYARTRTMTDLGNEDVGHGATPDHHTMQVGPGSTFVFVSGMGGASIRAYNEALHDDDTWWSTIYTTDHYRREGEVIEGHDVELGVMFIDFHVDGDPYKARGYFKNLDGEIIDEFDIFADEP
jgi:hypothetical protein